MKSGFAALAATALLVSAAYGQTTAAPTVSSLSPSSAPAGSPGFAMTVNGSNFRAGAFVSWNGFGISASLISSTQLTVNVPAVLLTTRGTIPVYVVNPGVAQSNSVTFTVGSGTSVAITTDSIAQATVGTPYSVTLTATGTPPYTWSANAALPAGLTLNSSGILSGTATEAGIFNVAVRVVDATGQAAAKSLALTIVQPPLSVVTAQLSNGRAGQSYSAALAATGGKAPYRWVANQGFPPGLRLDEATGAITGTPTTAGTYNFAVQVRDADQATATRSLSIRIDPPPLSITTVPPLFAGTVGLPYAQTFSATGSVPPYRWTIASGDTGGLTMDVGSGTLQGTPRTAGTFSFVVQVTDAASGAASQAFSVTVNPPSLTISTASVLPGGTVNVNYTQNFSVVGGTAPYSWKIIGGGVPGLTLDGSGVLSGAPASAGVFTTTVEARDAAGLTATRVFTVTIAAPPLRITTAADFPDATLAAEYSGRVSATGGVAPYTWASNGLPEGLTIDASTGLISGAPTAAGSYSFTVRVTDSARTAAVDLFRINVALPRTPSARIAGLPQTAPPAEQFPLEISLDSAFPAAITVQASLSFSPSTSTSAGDGTIQFSTGGRNVEMTVPAGMTSAASTAPLILQTGTVAGTIRVSLRLLAGGVDITPAPAPTATIQVERAAPVIRSARVVRNGNGLAVEVIGYSTSREITQFSVTFAAASGQTLQNSTVTVPVEDLFNRWFQDLTSAQYGSQFFYSQPFTIQGDANAVTPQSVTLVNRLGSTTASVQP